MEDDKEENTETNQEIEMVPILGIRPKWVDIALKLFSVVFFAYSFLVIREEFSKAQPLMATTESIVVHLAAFSVFETVILVAIFQGADLLMYLTERFRASLQRQLQKARVEAKAEGKAEGIAVGKVEGIAVGKVEGIAVGKVEVSQAVSAWNKRRLEAEAKGLSFDEPPPINTDEETK